jgi:hypothetical protein
MRRRIPFFLLMAVLSGCNAPKAARDEKRSASQEQDLTTPPTRDEKRSASQEDLSKVPTDELIRRLADTTGDARTGRYQMIAAKGNIFKFDTATGSAWAFDEHSASWRPLPDTPCSDASVEARIRTVVERAVTPLIVVNVYNPQTGHIDKLRQAEKERQIQAVVQQALGAYSNLKNDPLGLLDQNKR